MHQCSSSSRTNMPPTSGLFPCCHTALPKIHAVPGPVPGGPRCKSRGLHAAQAIDQIDPYISRPNGDQASPVSEKQRHQQQEQQQHQQFQQLLAEVQQQSFVELQQLLECQPQHKAFSASFLFWLSSLEKRAVGPQKQQLAQLAAQLVLLKEQSDFESSSRLLPPLASSLAYSNYSHWRASHSDRDLPEVTPGVTLSDLYKAAEQEEAKLKQWQSPRRPSSTLDNFAAASGYASFAADAMARVRARLAGFEDDDTLNMQQPPGKSRDERAAAAADTRQDLQGSAVVSPAAVLVLDELLINCCCREERATLLPEACVPPGLEVSATGSASSSQSSSATARVLTSPPRLLAAVAARLIDADQAAQQSQQEVLPSGESVVQALIELQEDIQDYDQHVYSRMSQRDMQGL